MCMADRGIDTFVYRDVDVFKEWDMTAWAVVGIYLRTLSTIAALFFLISVVFSWFVSAIRGNSPSQTWKYLLLYLAGLMAPLVVVFCTALAVKEVMT